MFWFKVMFHPVSSKDSEEDFFFLVAQDGCLILMLAVIRKRFNNIARKQLFQEETRLSQ